MKYFQNSEQKLPLSPKIEMLKKTEELKRGSGRFQEERNNSREESSKFTKFLKNEIYRFL